MKTLLWQTILVPHDFSASANRAAAIARDEARNHGGNIILLHAVDLPASFGPDSTLVMGDHGTPIGLGEHAISEATKHLEHIADRLAQDGVSVRAIVRVGTPFDVIEQVAAELHAGVIVMGTHGRTGLSHLIVGSVAERVVRTARVPVVTVRSVHSPSA
ncbi:MAG: universal stress protein [Kofleriaceae bacterium]